MNARAGVWDRLTEKEALELQLFAKRHGNKAAMELLALHKSTFDTVISGGRAKSFVIARVRARVAELAAKGAA